MAPPGSQVDSRLSGARLNGFANAWRVNELEFCMWELDFRALRPVTCIKTSNVTSGNHRRIPSKSQADMELFFKKTLPRGMIPMKSKDWPERLKRRVGHAYGKKMDARNETGNEYSRGFSEHLRDAEPQKPFFITGILRFAI